MKFLGGILLGVFLALSLPLRADLLADLSAADQARVKAGEQVMLDESIEGYPWPRVRVYQTVAATPREVMAVFFDYDNACHFIPNCTKSHVSKDLGPRSTEVDYVIDVPIFPDEAYTARNDLSQGGDGRLTVSWQVLHATSILESKGSLAVEPWGAGAILRYTNLVRPSSRAAFLLKGMAMGQMKDTVHALVAQVLSQKQAPASLQRNLQRLDEALGKKN